MAGRSAQRVNYTSGGTTVGVRNLQETEQEVREQYPGENEEFIQFQIAQTLASGTRPSGRKNIGLKNVGRKRADRIRAERAKPFSGLTDKDLERENRRRRGRAGRSLLAQGDGAVRQMLSPGTDDLLGV